jgi:hypothetical protein
VSCRARARGPVWGVSESWGASETGAAVLGGVLGAVRPVCGPVAGSGDRGRGVGGVAVAVVVVGRLACGRRQRGEPAEGGGELGGPRPVAVEAQDRLAGVEGDPGGDV